jgi:hypothetical protein
MTTQLIEKMVSSLLDYQSSQEGEHGTGRSNEELEAEGLTNPVITEALAYLEVYKTVPVNDQAAEIVRLRAELAEAKRDTMLISSCSDKLRVMHSQEIRILNELHRKELAGEAPRIPVTVNRRVKDLYKRARRLKISPDDFVLEEWEIRFADLLIRECAVIPDWAIETGRDQLVETCMAQRASKAILDNFGLTP